MLSTTCRSSLVVLVLAGVVCAAGCTPGAAQSGVAAPTAAPQAIAAPAPEAKCDGANKARALVHCAAASERAQSKPPAADDAFAEIARGCADLFSEPSCRNAYLAAVTAPPESRVNGILTACRTAYCPQLPEPKPPLCGDLSGMTAVDRLTEWRTFSRRVLALELGVSEEELPKDLGPYLHNDSFATLDQPAALTSSATSVVNVQVGLGPGGRLVVSLDSHGKVLSFPLPSTPTARDFAAAAEAAAKEAGPSGRVAILADTLVTHGTVIALVDALKQRGVTRIAFGVAAAR